MFEITWDFIEPHIIKNEGSVMNKGKNENFTSPECNNLNEYTAYEFWVF